MQLKLAALLSVALLAGCEQGRVDTETGAATGDRVGVDTLITTDRIADTTVVEADTAIDVDTIKDTDHISEEDR